MKFRTSKKILLIFILCIILKCLFLSNCVFADDLGENIPEIEIEAEQIGKKTVNGVGQGFTIINDNIMVNAVMNGDIFLVNKNNGIAYEESRLARGDHCNTITYDTEKKYIIAAEGQGELGADIYTFSDVGLKGLTFIKHLNHAPGNGIGYDKITGEFIGVGGHHIFAYKSEDFYAGKSPYKTFRINYDSSYRTIQSAEAYGGNVFYVMTDGNIDGNTILVINLEQEKPIMRLHWSHAQEMEDCAFDSQGNLYFSTTEYYYKTNYNAYAEGLVSTSPTNLIEVIASFVTQQLNTFLDWIQSMLESLETGEDFSKINLTYSASEIMEDQSLQSIVQVENVEIENKNQDENQDQGQDESQDQKQNQEQKEVQKDIDLEIQSKIDNKNGEEVMVYTSQTPIPSIKVSLDSIWSNKLELFDINFLDRSNTNSNKIWNVLKNLVNITARITLYICVILLIGTIIYRSILLVMATLGYKPERATKSKKIIDNFVTAVAIIVSLYLIIQLFMNFYNLILGLLIDKATNGVNTPYLIRTKINEVYCFNTNVMGLFKYLSLTTDIWGAFGWTFARLIMTIVNLFFCAILGARALIIGLLIIVAPIVAINTLSDRVPSPGKSWTNILFLKPFVKFYLIVLWWPILFVLVGLVI